MDGKPRRQTFIYYGNNTLRQLSMPKQIPGTNQVICIFLPTAPGVHCVSIAKRGVDRTSPANMAGKKAWSWWIKGDLDSFKWIEYFFEDPYPTQWELLPDLTIWAKKSPSGWMHPGLNPGVAIYLVGRDGTQELILEGSRASSIDDHRAASQTTAIPSNGNYTDKKGTFYVPERLSRYFYMKA